MLILCLSLVVQLSIALSVVWLQAVQIPSVCRIVLA